MSADLVDKPFPRSCLNEYTKSSSESVKRKESTKEVTATAVESTSHKEAVDSMFTFLHLSCKTARDVRLNFFRNR